MASDAVADDGQRLRRFQGPRNRRTARFTAGGVVAAIAGTHPPSGPSTMIRIVLRFGSARDSSMAGNLERNGRLRFASPSRAIFDTGSVGHGRIASGLRENTGSPMSIASPAPSCSLGSTCMFDLRDSGMVIWGDAKLAEAVDAYPGHDVVAGGAIHSQRALEDRVPDFKWDDDEVHHARGPGEDGPVRPGAVGLTLANASGRLSALATHWWLPRSRTVKSVGFIEQTMNRVEVRREALGIGSWKVTDPQ
jgi:hypothetical protein